VREDLEAVFDWYNDPEIVAPFDRFSVDSLDAFAAAVQAAPDDPRSLAPRYVVERKDDGRRLGLVGYYLPHPVLETIDVWYVVGATAERGKGYGKEAVGLLVTELFNAQPLERVGATCDVENQPSRHLLESLGFRVEGTIHQALYHHGRWHDVRAYGVTRAEWSSAFGASRKSTRAPPPGPV
jgi:RimJ/RimL family protein N-acetyltransferase